MLLGQPAQVTAEAPVQRAHDQDDDDAPSVDAATARHDDDDDDDDEAVSGDGHQHDPPATEQDSRLDTASTIEEPPLTAITTSHNKKKKNNLALTMSSSLEFQTLFRAIHEFDDYDSQLHVNVGDHEDDDDLLLLLQADDDDHDDSVAAAPVDLITVTRRFGRRTESPSSTVTHDATISTAAAAANDDNNNNLSMEQFLRDFECQLDETVSDLRRSINLQEQEQVLLQQVKRERAAVTIQSSWRRYANRSRNGMEEEELAHKTVELVAIAAEAMVVQSDDDDNWTCHEALRRDTAATRIQSLIRNHWRRRHNSSRMATDHNAAVAAIVINPSAIRGRQTKQTDVLMEEEGMAPNRQSLSTTRLASVWRGHVARRNRQVIQQAVWKLQAKVRMRQAKQRWKRQEETATILQRSIRRHQARRVRSKKIEEARLFNAASLVARQWRRFLAQESFRVSKLAAVKIQQVYRAYRVTVAKDCDLQDSAETQKAETPINWCLNQQPKVLSGDQQLDSVERRSIVIIQSIIRRYHAHGVYVKLHDMRMELAAIRLESFWRAFANRQRYWVIRHGVVWLQRRWRNRSTGSSPNQACLMPFELSLNYNGQAANHVLLHNAAIQMQSRVRRMLARKQFLKTMKAAIQIQRVTSAFLSKRRQSRAHLLAASTYFKHDWTARISSAFLLRIATNQKLVLAPYRLSSEKTNLVRFAPILHFCATRIQAVWRKALTYRKHLLLRDSVSKCQRAIRSHIARRRSITCMSVGHAVRLIDGVQVQSLCTATMPTNELQDDCEERAQVTNYVLSNPDATEKLVPILDDASKSANTIARAWQLLVIRRGSLLRAEDAMIIQAKMRRNMTQSRFSLMRKSNIEETEGSHCITQRGLQVIASKRIQRAYRDLRSRRHAQCVQVASVCLIEDAWLRYAAVKARRIHTAGVLVIQKAIKRRIARKRYQLKRDAATALACVRLQRRVRHFLVSCQSQRLRERSAKLIGGAWRTRAARRVQFSQRRSLATLPTSPPRIPGIPEYVTLTEHDIDSLSGTLEAKEPPSHKIDTRVNCLVLLLAALAVSALSALFLRSITWFRIVKLYGMQQNETLSEPIQFFTNCSFSPSSPLVLADDNTERASSVLSLTEDEVKSIQLHVISLYNRDVPSSMTCESGPTYIGNEDGRCIAKDPCIFDVALFDADKPADIIRDYSDRQANMHMMAHDDTGPSPPDALPATTSEFVELMSSGNQLADVFEEDGGCALTDAEPDQTVTLDLDNLHESAEKSIDWATGVEYYPASSVNSGSSTFSEKLGDIIERDVEEISFSFIAAVFGEASHNLAEAHPSAIKADTLETDANPSGFDEHFVGEALAPGPSEHIAYETVAVVMEGVYEEHTVQATHPHQANGCESFKRKLQEDVAVESTPSQTTNQVSDHFEQLQHATYPADYIRCSGISDLWTMDLEKIFSGELVAWSCTPSVPIASSDRLLELWTVDLDRYFEKVQDGEDVDAIKLDKTEVTVTAETSCEKSTAQLSDAIAAIMSDVTDRTTRCKAGIDQYHNPDFK